MKQNPEMNSWFCGQLIFDRFDKNTQGKINLINNKYPHKEEHRALFQTTGNNQFKMYWQQNTSAQIEKIQEENKKESFLVVGEQIFS